MNVSLVKPKGERLSGAIFVVHEQPAVSWSVLEATPVWLPDNTKITHGLHPVEGCQFDLNSFQAQTNPRPLIKLVL